MMSATVGFVAGNKDTVSSFMPHEAVDTPDE